MKKLTTQQKYIKKKVPLDDDQFSQRRALTLNLEIYKQSYLKKMDKKINITYIKVKQKNETIYG